MYGGKSTVISDSQMSNSFNLTANYLSHFVHNKNKVHSRETSMEGRADGGIGAIYGSGGCGGVRGRGDCNVISC